jgi:SAM-dependent methyltransferase
MIGAAKRIVKSILNTVASPAYNKQCSVCGKKVKKFIPLPDYYSDNATRYKYPYTIDEAETINDKEYTCPNCGASDRDRLYALYIEKALKPDIIYRLLDIAPGKALRSYLKQKSNISYRSADLIDKDVDDTGVDITNMKNYQDQAFDIFICSHVLEHVSDDRKAMKELHRILKKGGLGIAMVPIILTVDNIDEDPTLTDVAERWRRFGQDDHVRLYSKQGFKARLQEAGFTVNEVTRKDFGEQVFFRYGISPKSVLYIVNK